MILIILCGMSASLELLCSSYLLLNNSIILWSNNNMFFLIVFFSAMEFGVVLCMDTSVLVKKVFRAEITSKVFHMFYIYAWKMSFVCLTSILKLRSSPHDVFSISNTRDPDILYGLKKESIRRCITFLILFHSVVSYILILLCYGG